MVESSLSVVIIGRNEGSRLEKCIQSVWAMSHAFGGFDITYVDSGSGDGSATLAASLGANVVELEPGRMCAARARNAGWTTAKAPFVLFLDGDTILEPDFPAKALAEFRDPDMMVVYGNRREMNTAASVYNRTMDLDWIMPPGLKESCGGDAIFRRSALERAGGFNADLIAGEEPELCRRIRATGGLVLRIDMLMTRHDLGIATWSQYWRRAVRTGHAFAEVSALYRKSEYPLWLAESRSNLLNGSFYAAGFIAAVIATVLLHSWIYLAAFCAIFALRVLRTAITFRWKSSSGLTLLLFGIHSHTQQMPILLGQVKYWMHANSKSRVDLIEYKTP